MGVWIACCWGNSLLLLEHMSLQKKCFSYNCMAWNRQVAMQQEGASVLPFSHTVLPYKRVEVQGLYHFLSNRKCLSFHLRAFSSSSWQGQPCMPKSPESQTQARQTVRGLLNCVFVYVCVCIFSPLWQPKMTKCPYNHPDLMCLCVFADLIKKTKRAIVCMYVCVQVVKKRERECQIRIIV